MTAGDILTSSGKHPDRAMRWPPTLPMIHDAQVLASRVSALLTSYASSQDVCKGEPKVESGYRPPEINAATPGAAKNSNHMTCRAVDIEDPEGELASWCVFNIDLLEHFELYMEDPRYTPNWVHLQSVAPRSLSRIFQP